jgi:hypothetical protein
MSGMLRAMVGPPFQPRSFVLNSILGSCPGTVKEGGEEDLSADAEIDQNAIDCTKKTIKCLSDLRSFFLSLECKDP